MATCTKKSNKTNNFQKMSNTYPCNLLLDLFPNITKDNFSPAYITNLSIAIKILSNSYIGFKTLELQYKDCLSIDEIAERMRSNKFKVNQEQDDAKRMIIKNKEIIFNGFGHSKLRNKVISGLVSVGIHRDSATVLVDSGLYCVWDIMDLKDNKEFIKILSKNFEPSVVGRTLEDTLVALNRQQYDTTKFGYIGKKYSGTVEIDPKKYDKITSSKEDVLSIQNYDYNGFSDTTFKVKCPKCDRFFRIHLTGTIDDEGKLVLEKNPAIESGIFLCQHCMTPVNIDKVDKFIRNYL